jgi:signal transduction histidine kinase
MLVNDFDDLDPGAALKLVRRAQRSAAWLQTLTENLTSAACIESGTLDVQAQPTDLRECIEDAVLLVRGLLDQRGQSVSVSAIPDEATHAHADHGRVVQIIANLLSNASRYSVDADTLEIHVAPTRQHLRISVTDHGPGISPDDQQRIFGSWTRLEGAAPGGLGLGLSIVRGLVQQHGGRVGVESTLGKGATFWFTLPMAVAEMPLAVCL